MEVICRIKECPYHSGNDFCLKRFLVMNPNGFCGHIYNKRGEIKGDWREPVEKRGDPDERIHEPAPAHYD